MGCCACEVRLVARERDLAPEGTSRTGTKIEGAKRRKSLGLLKLKFCNPVNHKRENVTRRKYINA